MKRRWRLILDDKYDGYYNMAVDEAILLNYSKERKPTLRIYGWKYPFITFINEGKETAFDIPFALAPNL